MCCGCWEQGCVVGPQHPDPRTVPRLCLVWPPRHTTLISDHSSFLRQLHTPQSSLSLPLPYPEAAVTSRSSSHPTSMHSLSRHRDTYRSKHVFSQLLRFTSPSKSYPLSFWAARGWGLSHPSWGKEVLVSDENVNASCSVCGTCFLNLHSSSFMSNWGDEIGTNNA